MANQWNNLWNAELKSWKNGDKRRGKKAKKRNGGNRGKTPNPQFGKNNPPNKAGTLWQNQR